MATRATIGHTEVIALADCAPPPFAPQDFFPDVPLAGWDAHRDALDEEGKFRTNFGVFVLRGPDYTVLVDTGAGPGPIEALGGAEGTLLRGLEHAGVSQAHVDAVVFTHLHFDHIGWALTRDRDGEPSATFPNARYVVSRTEWDHWTQPGVADEPPEDIRHSILPLEALGVLDLADGEQTVVAGVRTVPTPGHTPGHQSVFVESDGSRGLIAGDIIHSSAQVTELEWCSGFDMDYETARRSRRRMIEQAAAERMLVAAGHLLLDSNIGHVVGLDGGYRWQPL